VGQELTRAQYLVRAAPLCVRLRLLPERIAREPVAKQTAFHDWSLEAKLKTPIAVSLAKLKPPTAAQTTIARLNGLLATRIAYLRRLGNPDYYVHRFSSLAERSTAYQADFDEVTRLDHEINAEALMYGLPPCAPGGPTRNFGTFG
jgi:hypothetical protein